MLSYQAAEAVARGKLKIVLGAFEREPLPVNLVHAGQGLLPLKTRSFSNSRRCVFGGVLRHCQPALQSPATNKRGPTR